MQTTVLLGLLALFGTSLAIPFKTHNHNAEAFQQRAFEGLIENVVNTLSDLVSLVDPVHISQRSLSLLGHEGEVTNLHGEGYSNFAATKVKMTIGLVTWKLELETLAPKTWGSIEHWKVDGPLFYGDGFGSYFIEDFKLSITAKINPIAILVKELHITPSIGHAEVSINGLYNDPELSQHVTDVFNKFLNDTVNNNTAFHDKISEIVLVAINTVRDFILGGN